MTGIARKILIIDDEEMMRDTIAMMLEDGDFEIRGAADGNIGLRELETYRPDLVITDIIMPNKEGIETILEIRRKWPDLPIIAISGGGRTSNMDFLEAAKKFGANETLHKPFTVDEIVAAVCRLLGADVGPAVEGRY